MKSANTASNPGGITSEQTITGSGTLPPQTGCMNAIPRQMTVATAEIAFNNGDHGAE
jgi:hypothetical protein